MLPPPVPQCRSQDNFTDLPESQESPADSDEEAQVEVEPLPTVEEVRRVPKPSPSSAPNITCESQLPTSENGPLDNDAFPAVSTHCLFGLNEKIEEAKMQVEKAKQAKKAKQERAKQAKQPSRAPTPQEERKATLEAKKAALNKRILELQEQLKGDELGKGLEPKPEPKKTVEKLRGRPSFSIIKRTNHEMTEVWEGSGRHPGHGWSSGRFPGLGGRKGGVLGTASDSRES